MSPRPSTRAYAAEDVPAWAQPYLDCVPMAQFFGLGGRRVRVEMYRGPSFELMALAGVIEIEVPEEMVL